MADFDTNSPDSSRAPAISGQPLATLSRRQRPPEIDITAAMEDRVPLLATKEARSSKRESKLGFRSIFARHRGSSGADGIKAARNVVRAGKRESMTADRDGSPPYALRPTAVQSETHLAPLSAEGPLLRPRTSSIKSPNSMPQRSPLGAAAKRRGSLATWDPVPLFQAYPQALRATTLPACVQADSLLRAHQKREIISNSNINHPDLGDQKALFADMARKKHKRDSSSARLDWTTKLYVLVTSGYLLQYSGSGTHDRLPEKVIQLCKDSAAFASDIIPGKHWVLQVSSVFEEGALISQDTRSLFGKFGVREKEKRLASDILMVFENADDMEDWMSFLRREIESLGGKRPMTETGAPKEPVDHTQFKSQPSQRALVVRDPCRFAPATDNPDMRWDPTVTLGEPELHLDGTTLTELLPDRTFDDDSTTNSFVSQDGRQLEGLRDNSNRFSFTSAARTIVTSDSSPSNSPIRDSFGSLMSSSDEPTPLAEETEVRRRPNAAEIEDRRQSYRTANMVHDIGAGRPQHRAHSSLSSIQDPPNFSLPYAGTRRRSATQDSAHVQNAHSAPGRPPRRTRRPPPSALGLSRPLSIVADTPSPSKLSPLPPRSPLETGDSAGVSECPNSPSMCSFWAAGNAKPEYDLSSRASSRGSVRTSYQVSVHNSPRKYASMHTLRPVDDTVWETPKFEAPAHAAIGVSSHRDEADEAAGVPRSMSSLDTYQSSGRSRSPIIRAAGAQKRASMCSLPGAKASPKHRSVSMFPTTSQHRATSRSPNRGSPRRGSAMTIPGHGQKLPIYSPRGSNVLNNRRSLPQMPHTLAQPSPLPPPPAPPPTKALPPLPRARKMRSSSIPPRIGMRAPTTLVGGEI